MLKAFMGLGWIITFFTLLAFAVCVMVAKKLWERKNAPRPKAIITPQARMRGDPVNIGIYRASHPKKIRSRIKKAS